MNVVKVGFLDKKTKKEFEKLKSGKFEDRELHRLLKRAFDNIEKDPEVGVDIPKNQIPKEYIKKYGINNLRKYDVALT